MIDWDELHSYLEDVKGLKWFDRTVSTGPGSEGEVLTEAAGRMCYRSWDVGLNPNVTQVREDSQKYFDNLLASGHGSVLEHANYTFIMSDVSRVFTHELVRHRVGIAISQESLRYVRLTDIPFRIPKELLQVITGAEVEEVVTYLENIQKRMGSRLESMNLPMHEKKAITSAMRRLAPLGLSTAITWTANIRELRHVIKMRTAPDAEEEMRIVFGLVGDIMKRECPRLFSDFQVKEGAYVPQFVKV